MTDRTHTKSHKHESIEYRALVVMTFPIFLVGAVLGRLVPSKAHVESTMTSAKLSVFGEARAAADTYVPFVFMG
jgi:hypothetical protein